MDQVRMEVMMPASGRQISVRVSPEIDAWLEQRSGGGANKAGFIRRLINQEMAREREQELLDMFNAAAAERAEDDVEETEALLGAFAAAEDLGEE
jgi:hypothetical protein